MRFPPIAAVSALEGRQSMKWDCLVCGGKLRPSHVPGLLRCEECKFTTANLTLSEEQLRQLYTAGYFTGNEYRDYVADRSVIEKQSRLRLQRLLPFVTDARSKRLFEIGCAHGFFLEVARTTFRSVEGIDISADAIAYARQHLGLEARSADFLTHQFGVQPDLICLWDTIEHLSRPDLYLQKMADSLPPGGLLALTTGDLDSWLARARGRRWRQIHPPTHLHYFSRETLSRLLQRCGFVIKFIGWEGMFRSVDTMAYILLCLKHQRPNLYATLRKAHLLNWDLYLNLGDIVFVVAERK
jgi:2-polyprenyl-3-methyl-5-hydroxy-6-metoxy-1,4-benzoquinol methylase